MCAERGVGPNSMRASAASLAVAAVVALAVAASGSASPPKPFPRFAEPNCSRADFTSAGTRIRAELCRATSDAKAGRAVVVLHGCGGFSTLDHRITATLPADGIATLYVDYFGPTPPPGTKGFCGGRGAGLTAFTGFRDVFARWQQVVEDAGSALRGTPRIDPHRVGLVGWSLGGGLAVATAAAADSGRSAATRPFAAVVGFSTGSGRGGRAPTSLPPLLLLSGGVHDAIPLADTRALYDAARAAGVHAELFVYPNGSHDWPGRQGTVGISRAARFLRAVL